nr:MAG TPA: hypothetical protein [Caudoviricetes sp.]
MEDADLWGEVLKYLGLGGVGAGGGVGAAFLVRWVGRKLTEESLATQRATWEAEFITGLRSEIERLTGLTHSFYEQIGDMHQRIIELTAENIRLKTRLAELEAGSHKE